MNLVYYLLTVYLALNFLMTLINILLLRKVLKKETWAIIQRKDGNNTQLKVNPNNKSFTHEEKVYLLPKKSMLRFRRKTLILYNDNDPNPVDTLSHPLHKQLSSQAIYSVVYSEALRILNRPTGLLGGMDIKKIAIIGALVVVAIMIFRGG